MPLNYPDSPSLNYPNSSNLKYPEDKKESKTSGVFGQYTRDGKDWFSGEVPDDIVNPKKDVVNEFRKNQELRTGQSKYVKPDPLAEYMARSGIKPSTISEVTPIAPVEDINEPIRGKKQPYTSKTIIDGKEVLLRKLDPDKDIGEEMKDREVGIREYYKEKDLKATFIEMAEEKKVKDAAQLERLEGLGIDQKYIDAIMDETPATSFVGKRLEDIELAFQSIIQPGLTGTLEGIITKVTGDQKNIEWIQRLNNRTMVDVYVNHAKLLPREDDSTLDKLFGIVTTSATYMATIIAASAFGTLVGGPAGGTAAGFSTMATIGGGNFYNDLLSRGVHPNDAMPLSATYGILEAYIENAIGIKPGTLGKSIVGDGIRKTALKTFTDSKFMGTLVKLGKTAFVEGTEEFAQSFTENFLAKFVDDNQALFEKDMLEEFGSGALGGLAFGGIAATPTLSKQFSEEGIPLGLSIEDVSKKGPDDDGDPKAFAKINQEKFDIAEMKEGDAVVINADKYKEKYNDYDPVNHERYSKMSKQLYEKALKEVNDPVVNFTAGGAGSGKSELVVSQLTEDYNVGGIIYDGVMKDYDSFIKSADMAKEAGKSIEIYAILPRINSAWKFVQKRAIETGRNVPLEVFVNGHIGFVNTLEKIIENNPEIDVGIKDTRKIFKKSEAKDAGYVYGPEVLDILSDTAYTKNGLLNQLKYVKLSKKGERKALANKERRERSELEVSRKGKEAERAIKEESKEVDKLVEGQRADTGVDAEFQVGVTSVKGREAQKSDKLVDKAEKLEAEGKFAEAQKLYKGALIPGVRAIKEKFPPNGIKITAVRRSFGRYFGATEPTIYLKFRVKEGSVDEFIEKISILSDVTFKQKSVIIHKWVDPNTEYGIVDKDSGLSNEPAVEIILNKRVSLDKFKEFDELLNKNNLAGATITPNGYGIEMMNLSAYNTNYEEFSNNIQNFIQDLKRNGSYESYKSGTKETRHIGINTDEALTTYERISGGVQAVPVKEEVKTKEKKPKAPAKGKVLLDGSEPVTVYRGASGGKTIEQSLAEGKPVFVSLLESDAESWAETRKKQNKKDYTVSNYTFVPKILEMNGVQLLKDIKKTDPEFAKTEDFKEAGYAYDETNKEGNGLQKIMNWIPEKMTEAVQGMGFNAMKGNVGDLVLFPEVKEVKPPSAKKILGIEPAPFVTIKKRETTLLKEKIRDIQKQAKAESWSKAKLARELDKVRISREKAVRKEQLKTTKVGITERFKGIQKGIREGTINTKAEIKTTQTELLSILDEAKLEAKDKSKFRKTIKNIQTKKQLEKALPDFREKVEAMAEKSTRKRLKTKIKNEFKKLRAKKGERGKTSVEYEMLRNALRTKYFKDGKIGGELRTQAENDIIFQELQRSIEDYDISNPVNYEDFISYAVLSESTKGLNEMSIAELEDALTRLQQTKKLARDSFLFKQLDRASEIKKLIDGSIENMQGKGMRKQTPSNRKTIRKSLKKFVATTDIHDRGFLQIVNLLDSVRGGKFYKDVIYQPIMEANKEYFVKNEEYLDKDQEMLEEIFDKKGTLLDTKIKKLSKQIHIGETIDAQNNKFDLWFTNLEMIDIYLSSKTEANKLAMEEQGIYVGGKDADTRVFYMTQDVIDKIEGNMSKESKDIAEYILENIQDKKFSREMTEAYEAKYNKPFPFVKGGYWTMRRRYMGGKQKGKDVFNPEYSQKTIISPSSFLKRVENDNPLKITDAWSKYIKWRSDILKFVSYDQSLTNAKSIIMSSDFKSEFIEIYGNKSYNHLLNSFDVTANGMKNYSDLMANGVNYIRQVLSVSFIGGKLRNILSQGSSFIAATSDIPIRDFNKSLGKFVAHPKAGYNKMMESPIIRLRHKRANFTKGLFETEVAKFKQYGFSTTKTAMFFTKVGDMMGVIGAGYAIYDYNYSQYVENGMDSVEADKRAMQDAEIFIVSTQQSALVELKNAIMQSHPLVRTTGSFQQAQSMYRAKGYESMNTWINSENKWDKKNFRKMAKGVFTYHFVLPALYETSRGNINPLSITAKTVFSPISGFMGYGKIVEWGVMYSIVKVLIPMLGGDEDDWKDILTFDPSSLVGESKLIFEKTVNSMNDWIEGEQDEKDITNLIDSGLMLLRVPSKNIREEYKKFQDIYTGEDRSFLRLFQTEWQSEQRAKESGIKVPTVKVPKVKTPKVKIPKVKI